MKQSASRNLISFFACSSLDTGSRWMAYLPPDEPVNGDHEGGKGGLDSELSVSSADIYAAAQEHQVPVRYNKLSCNMSYRYKKHVANIYC